MPQTIDVQALMRGLVHELRNPLAAILTATNLLNAGDDLDEETAMLLEVVQKESRRMNRILTEFSSFVKPPLAQSEAFDLAGMARDILSDLADEASWQKVNVCDELPEHLWVKADPVQIHLALTNLLTNAAEAMSEGGDLRLSARVEKGETCLCFDDSGEGLEELVLTQAFQPFFSTKPHSTGLGLPIAKAIILSSGGTLEIENREGGARVKIELPTAQEPEEGEL